MPDVAVAVVAAADDVAAVVAAAAVVFASASRRVDWAGRRLFGDADVGRRRLENVPSWRERPRGSLRSWQLASLKRISSINFS